MKTKEIKVELELDDVKDLIDSIYIPTPSADTSSEQYTEYKTIEDGIQVKYGVIYYICGKCAEFPSGLVDIMYCLSVEHENPNAEVEYEKSEELSDYLSKTLNDVEDRIYESIDWESK